ncbi:hypothetical protein NMY22_g7672 [Coprinellus aureogranulatus]|nr:hypothetical protein NMY22_g7672 [Coprinellus aureogranulatus]
MIGSDSNLDILQICWRIAGAIEAANILAQFPHWDRPPRRLKLLLMKELPRSSDHLKPHSWKVPPKVAPVTLQPAHDKNNVFGHSIVSPFAACCVARLNIDDGILSTKLVLLCQFTQAAQNDGDSVKMGWQQGAHRSHAYRLWLTKRA